MKVLIDQDKCVGSGQCVLAAPTVFDQRDEDGIAVLLTETPTEDAGRAPGRPRGSARRWPSSSKADFLSGSS